MAAAERGIWSAADLRRLLASKVGYELSAPSVTALMTGDPAMVKLTTLAALCEALHCTPNDLFDTNCAPTVREVVESQPPEWPTRGTGMNGSGASVISLMQALPGS